jgi:glycogen(starch) synthase
VNLIFYSPRFYPLVGGLEKVVRVWAEELSAQGHEIMVITETAPTEPDSFPFSVYRNISWKEQVSLMKKAEAVVQFNVSLKGLPACLISGRPLIISHHTALFFPNGKTPWQQKLKRWVSDLLAKGNISCSSYIAGQFRTSAVVHSPYEAGLFVNHHKYRKPQSIVFVGRLVSDKGVDLLLNAFAAIMPSYPQALLTIVGEGPDRDALGAMANSLEAGERIDFKGKLSGQALVDVLNEKEIMVVPSRMEPFGTTVLEGLACGCRMIVSDQGGLPEAAGGLGRLFASGNPGDLVSALESELQHPRELVKAELETHLETHSVAHTARAFLKTIQQILATASMSGNTSIAGQSC